MMGTLFSMNAALYSYNQGVGKARADIWLSILVAAIPVAVSIWLMFSTARRFPDRSLLEALIVRHPFVGRCIAALYMVFFFIILIRDLRLANDFINMVLLPFTPNKVTMLLIILTIILIARNPADAVIRMNQFWQPLFLLTGAMIFFMLFNRFELSNFLPMFDNGIVPSLEGAWFYFAFLGEMIVLPFIFSGREITVRRGLISLVASVIVLELIGFALIAVLGAHIPSMLLFPIFNLIEFIKITDFLDRFELMLVSIYLPSEIVKCSILLFVLSRGLGHFLSGAGHAANGTAGQPPASGAGAVRAGGINPSDTIGYPLVVPLGALSFCGAYLFFHDTVELFPLNRVWPVLSAPLVFILPIFLYIFLRPGKQSIQRQGNR
jgi:spore germination protein